MSVSEKIRRRKAAIDDCFVTDRITELDAISPNLNGKMGEAIDKSHKYDDMMARSRRCRTAGQVFTEFAVDAAILKVEEMHVAKTSQSRQRAQETVLEYALGKPIARSMTLRANISDCSDEELENDIRSLLSELSFTPREGASSRLFIGPKTPTGDIQTSSVETLAGVSGEVHPIDDQGAADNGREPSREN